MSFKITRLGLSALARNAVRCKQIRLASSFSKNIEGEKTLVANDSLVAPLFRHSGRGFKIYLLYSRLCLFSYENINWYPRVSGII